MLIRAFPCVLVFAILAGASPQDSKQKPIALDWSKIPYLGEKTEAKKNAAARSLYEGKLVSIRGGRLEDVRWNETSRLITATISHPIKSTGGFPLSIRIKAEIPDAEEFALKRFVEGGKQITAVGKVSGRKGSDAGQLTIEGLRIDGFDHQEVAAKQVPKAKREHSYFQPPLKIEDVGYVQRTSEGRKVKVLRVIDDKSVTAYLHFWATPDNNVGRDSKTEVIIRGIDAKNAVDGEWMDVNVKLVVGREKYKGRTMFSLTPAKKD